MFRSTYQSASIALSSNSAFVYHRERFHGESCLVYPLRTVENNHSLKAILNFCRQVPIDSKQTTDLHNLRSALFFALPDKFEGDQSPIRQLEMDLERVCNQATRSGNPANTKIDIALLRQLAGSLHPVDPQLFRLIIRYDQCNGAGFGDLTSVASLLQDRILQYQESLLFRGRHISVKKEHTKVEIFKRIVSARQFIVQHFETANSLSQVARASCLSASQLLKYYAVVFGVSPHQEIIALKVRYAECLLRHTSLSVGEIVLEVGFRNASSFIRLFRSLKGSTPKQFRELSLGLSGKYRKCTSV